MTQLSDDGVRPVLWVEDFPAVIRGARLRLQTKTGRDVTRLAGSREAARRLLREMTFSFLVLDLRLPESDDTAEEVDPRAGKRLAVELKSGSLGERNRDIPFAVHTGNVNFVDDELTELPGYRGFWNKVDHIDPMLGEICETLGIAVQERTWRVPVRLLDWNKSDQTIDIIVDAWDSERRVAISLDRLPTPVLRARLMQEGELVVQALVNLSAQRDGDVVLEVLDLVDVPSDEELGF